VRDRFNRIYGGQPVPLGYEQAVIDLMQDQLWAAVVKAFNPKKPKGKK
jgi:hypothetical protein